MTPDPGVYGWSTGTGGVHFHRLAEPLRVARAAGIAADSGQRLDNDLCARYDTIVTHMLWDEWNSIAWEELAARGNHRLVFDIDDVMWAPDWDVFAAHYTPEVLARVWRNISLAHVVTTPSEVIAEYVSRYNRNVHFVPNTVPEYVLRIGANRPDHKGLIVGYQGSTSHESDYTPEFLRGLDGFLTDFPAWKFHLWGKRPHEVALWPTRVDSVVPWQDSLKRYYLSLRMDVGLGPLKRSPFNDGKSALRAIEYAALGIVAVLADEPPYRGWVEPGVTGILVHPAHSWRDALGQLGDDPLWRASMAQEAHRRAEAWTTEANVHRWVDAWNSV